MARQVSERKETRQRRPVSRVPGLPLRSPDSSYSYTAPTLGLDPVTINSPTVTSHRPAPALEVFVPGPLRNPMNGSRGPWQKHWRWARDWRERTTQRLLLAKLTGDAQARQVFADPRAPKTVRLIAHTVRPWDQDALPAGLKPVLDGLVDARVLQSDGPEAGHVVTYAQVVAAEHRGVAIVVALVPSIGASDGRSAPLVQGLDKSAGGHGRAPG